MVLALDNAGGGGPVVVDSAPAAMKMSELMSEIIGTAAAMVQINIDIDLTEIPIEWMSDA
jgi:hypothetical protein